MKTQAFPWPLCWMKRKQWFAVASSQSPPDTEAPWGAKWSRQLKEALSFDTCNSVVAPNHARKPGRESSARNTSHVLSASRMGSVHATRRDNTPKIWSSLQWVWDFRRNNIPASLIFLRAMRLLRYWAVKAFFSSRTQLSPINKSFEGMDVLRPLHIKLTCSRVSAMICSTDELSWRVDSSNTRICRTYPWQKNHVWTQDETISNYN